MLTMHFDKGIGGAELKERDMYAKLVDKCVWRRRELFTCSAGDGFVSLYEQCSVDKEKRLLSQSGTSVFLFRTW